MKSHLLNSKVKTYTASSSSSTKAVVTTQQAAFELKQRLILSLNKLSDRDTHQIGIEELDKAAEGLAPEGIAPFLSCITDTDSEQKSTVRRECVRVMATLARVHGALLLPHLGKMVTSIVKRLKDSDSVVRDSCVEASGVLMSNVQTSSSIGSEGGGGPTFIAIVKPLFEALGEQNRYVQIGSALCLARVIDEASNPPPVLLTQILTRVIKLLRNPHFMAKPAIIEMIRSVVQAGGASTEHALSAAVTSISETLKSTDWTTRKAASVALARIAVCAGPLLGSLKTSCILSLESCRFDKVKPVRDTIMHALQCWKNLPGSNSSEPSEAGSSTKENINGDYADVTCASDGVWRETSFRRTGPVSAFNGTSTSESKKRTPLSVRKACSNYVQNCHNSSSKDWHIEMSVAKTHSITSRDSQLKGFGEGCTLMASETAVDANKGEDVKCDYDPAEDNIECFSLSDLVSGSFETKHVTGDEGKFPSSIGINHRSVFEEVDPEGSRMQECRSLDSTVTDLNIRHVHSCCLHAANELATIRKQLVEIETKQSSLLDFLQVFMRTSVDNLSTIQLTVHNLEHRLDGISFNGNHATTHNSKLLKKNQCSNSPRLSISTPRPSMESTCRQPSLASLDNKEICGDKSSSSRSRYRTSVKGGVELWRDQTVSIIRNPIAKVSQKDSEITALNSGYSQTRERNMRSVPASNASAKQCIAEGKNGFWKQIEELLYAGDVESAYAEALYYGDDLCLVELMNRTGPILERLSCETAGTIVTIMTTHFLMRRFTDSIIPWFLQLVHLSNAGETGDLVMSSKTRLDILYALRAAAAMECIEPEDRLAVTECAAKLSKLWSEASSRMHAATRGSRGNKHMVPSTRV